MFWASENRIGIRDAFCGIELTCSHDDVDVLRLMGRSTQLCMVIRAYERRVLFVSRDEVYWCCFSVSRHILIRNCSFGSGTLHATNENLANSKRLVCTGGDRRFRSILLEYYLHSRWSNYVGRTTLL